MDTRSVEVMFKAAEEAGYIVEWALETHAHADHLSGAPYIKAKTGAKIGIAEIEFVALRTARDAKLAAPWLLLPSIQTNIRAGDRERMGSGSAEGGACEGPLGVLSGAAMDRAQKSFL